MSILDLMTTEDAALHDAKSVGGCDYMPHRPLTGSRSIDTRR